MDSRTTRRRLLGAGAAGLAALAGCAGTGGGGPSEPTDTATDLPATDSETSGGDTPTDSSTVASGKLPPTRETPLPLSYSLETLRSRIVSGGPGKDGIPSIDEPAFTDAGSVSDSLTNEDPVFGVVRNGEAKAYPQYILVWHEITNDVIGGDPVSVTYCPLTGTAMGFERGETTFGVSGRLVNNNLVMYDRAGDGRWPQVLGTAIEGPQAGESLQEFRVVWTTWRNWRQLHPDTKVLTEDTGFLRNYGSDPYGQYTPQKGGYYANDRLLFGTLSDDTRLPLKHVVLGARTHDGVLAFDLRVLRTEGVMTTDREGTPFVGVYDAALDTGYVYRNPEGAAVAATDERAVTVDGTEHPPDELPLDRVLATEGMWFAWSGFYPETELYG